MSDERIKLALQLSQLKKPPFAAQLPDGRHSCPLYVLSFPWHTDAKLKYARRHNLYQNEVYRQGPVAHAHLTAHLERLKPLGVYFCIVKKGHLRFDSIAVAANDSSEEFRLADDIDRILKIRSFLGTEGCPQWYKAD